MHAKIYGGTVIACDVEAEYPRFSILITVSRHEFISENTSNSYIVGSVKDMPAMAAFWDNSIAPLFNQSVIERCNQILDKTN